MRFTKLLLCTTAVASLAVPSAAVAKHGADDPAGHARHGSHHARKHHARKHHGVLVAHKRHGADDGAAHR
jgi:Ni/Co efflux regulator RcnB